MDLPASPLSRATSRSPRHPAAPECSVPNGCRSVLRCGHQHVVPRFDHTAQNRGAPPRGTRAGARRTGWRRDRREDSATPRRGGEGVLPSAPIPSIRTASCSRDARMCQRSVCRLNGPARHPASVPVEVRRGIPAPSPTGQGRELPRPERGSLCSPGGLRQQGRPDQRPGMQRPTRPVRNPARRGSSRRREQ